MERLEPNRFGSGSSSCSDAASLDVDVDVVREVGIVARVDDLASKRKHFSPLHHLLCHAHHDDETVDCLRLK